MVIKSYFIFVMLFIMFSCGRNEQNVDIKNNIKNENNNTEVIKDNFKKKEAIINLDCDYYLLHSDKPSGRLLKGQIIVILDYFYIMGIDEYSFDIFIEIETIDGMIKGYVKEKNINYLDNIVNNIQLKNILLTRNYYYNESVEYIYNRDYLPLIYEEVSKRDTVLMMGHFFSEWRLFISERYFYIYNDHNSSIFRIISLNQAENNTVLILTNHLKEEFEIILFNGKNNIIITDYTEIYNFNQSYHIKIIEDLINVEYIQYDEEISIKLKDNVLEWTRYESNR